MTGSYLMSSVGLSPEMVIEDAGESVRKTATGIDRQAQSDCAIIFGESNAKYVYAEFDMTNININNINDFGFGISTLGDDLSHYTGYSSSSFGLYNNGSITNNAVNKISNIKFNQGSRGMIFIDLFSGSLWLGADGAWAGNPYLLTDPVATGLTGSYKASVTLRYADEKITAKFSPDQWIYMPPQYGSLPIWYGKVAGKGTLDTSSGPAASLIRAHDESRGIFFGEAIPDNSGAWTMFVPNGLNMMVTTIGPSGYQPITDGPLVAVEI